MAKRKTNRRKKQSNSGYQALALLIILVLIIVGLLNLGIIGQIVRAIIQFFVGQLYLVVMVLGLVIVIYYLLAGRGVNWNNRFNLSLLMLLPIVLTLLHAWSYQSIAARQESVITITFNRGLTNFSQDQLSQLGGGLIGGILYALSYLLVSQIGTYILCGLALIVIFCFLFNITWFDLLEGFRLLADAVANWVKSFGQATSQQFADYQQANQDKKAAKAKQASSDQQARPSHRKKNQVKAAENQDVNRYERDEEVPIIAASGQTRQTNNGQPEQTQLDIPDIQAHKLAKDEDHSRDSHDDGDSDLDMADIDQMVMSGDDENPNYQLPPASLLSHVEATDQSSEYDVIKQNIKKLEATFESFNVDARVVKANLGPSVTKYEVEPAVGVKVSKIVGLSDDIALSLAAKDIRIEAPIPGRSVIGIEVPNQQVSLVSFKESFENQPSSDKLLEVPLGRDISGNIRTADLTKMPHLLVAGSTGSGKSVAINGIIVSILLKAKPNQVKLMMIDPKKVELNVYNGIPHLLTPVVTNPRKAAQALNKVVQEMERRYELFAATGQRNIDAYNELVHHNQTSNDEAISQLPYIVVIVDELADLMMVASKEVEAAITRLAQMARAAGIHMILATQRPSVDVITGIIKANVPSRMAFAVSSGTDSRTIIDQNGAEKLLGRGDMLFMPMGESKPVRIQGAFIRDEDVETVVDFVKDQQEANYVEAMMPTDQEAIDPGEEVDELFDQALDYVKTQENISTSKLQRRFRIGYNRAARMIEDMEMRGYVGPQEGSKARVVNIYQEKTDDDLPQ
ncbi:cell division protein FtsK [Aerococcus urinaehominis]|uniref:DNA translocase FtsK n=1 Tax=Aerococcus urinaehominis TaxID=128944 RepID=A0A109RI64_9LACT|nr:DNA translocase FtsK [Aerococcus urinaehominis]AMB99685.1 cell division protein FtsK [Aerococcus urinaehominis]SDL90441.1 DNA segregation ATPase FtsK/SpoIIIE, S-DNA-T family [Aerococcus urinaehominis]